MEKLSVNYEMENKASQLFKVYVDGFAPPEWSKKYIE